MTLYVNQVEVNFGHDYVDATSMNDLGSRMLMTQREIRFEISGLCSDAADLELLRGLIEERHGLLDVFREVASCEWCGALYPRVETRCRRGCGGPRTDA